MSADEVSTDLIDDLEGTAGEVINGKYDRAECCEILIQAAERIATLEAQVKTQSNLLLQHEKSGYKQSQRIATLQSQVEQAAQMLESLDSCAWEETTAEALRILRP